MKIEVYFDDDISPRQILEAPAKFELDTTELSDGLHKVILKTVEKDTIQSVRSFDIEVKNGPEITVHGLIDGDTVTGKIQLTANAYGSRIGDVFESSRIESPTPIPTWAWVLCLVTLAWSVGYLSQTMHLRKTDAITATNSSNSNENTQSSIKTSSDENSDMNANWIALGKQVYGNNCSSCHQGDGGGLPGVFPSLKGNSVVINDNAEEHIVTVLNGLQGKKIDGVLYASPMPGFGSTLSNEEIAAVINHERTQWGNNAKTVTPDDVKSLR